MEDTDHESLVFDFQEVLATSEELNRIVPDVNALIQLDNHHYQDKNVVEHTDKIQVTFDGEGESSPTLVRVDDTMDFPGPGDVYNAPSENLEDLAASGSAARPRKRNKRAQPAVWKRNYNKEKRMEGVTYQGFSICFKEDTGGFKIRKQHQNVTKEGKAKGPPCASLTCAKSRKRLCHTISEPIRLHLFQTFWSNMDWGQKKVYIASLVKYLPVKQKTTETEKRSGIYAYYIKYEEEGNKKIVQVCQAMFLSTFRISKRQVHNWIGKSLAGIPINNSTPPKAIKSSEVSNGVKKFLKSLPNLPSHYRRSQSTKLYLEPIFTTKCQLFAEYLSKCKQDNVNPASRWTFMNCFEELNFSIFQPKNDKCDTCCSYKNKNVPEAQYQLHLLKKNEARLEKTKDKEYAADGACHTLTMDVESVKVCPSLKASALYYKTKLCLHNFTIYNLLTHDTTCYWWNEVEGELVASTFATCVIVYIKKSFQQDNLPIVIFSDGCTAQNRNAAMSNALLHFSITSGKVIYQKFLEKGHTQMECDSVHSKIEAKLTNREIYLPTDYISACKEARKRQGPYKAEYLTHQFFRNYTQQSIYTSIRPGKLTGDATVTDLRVLKYSPEGKIFYKLRYNDDFKELPKRPKKVSAVNQFKLLYTGRIPISARKWNDLQDLKFVLPADCHSFYDQLPKM